MKKVLFSIIAVALSQTAFADQTVFSCFMNNGKHLSVQQVGSDLRYSYGKPGKPEMVFVNKINMVERDCGTQACNLTMENKGVEYWVWGNFRGDAAGGVEVSKKGKTLASTHCDSHREIYIDGNYFF